LVEDEIHGLCMHVVAAFPYRAWQKKNAFCASDFSIAYFNMPEERNIGKNS
jgi:hypothetical protein